MRVLALDLSLTCTGYCRDGEVGRLRYPKDKGWDRMALITDAIDDLTAGVDLVVLEGYSFGSKGRSVFQIAELGGIVRNDLQRLGMPWVDVPPSSLKKYATGRGNAGKDEMVAAAIRRFGFAGHDNNEADALLLWHMAMAAYGDTRIKTPLLNASALDSVEWPDVCPLSAQLELSAQIRAPRTAGRDPQK